jgi:hypothetical protein
MNSLMQYSLKLAAVLVLFVFALVPQAPAQQSSAFDGRFKLSEPVNWQGKILPAGEYTFSISSISYPARLILHGPKGNTVILASGRSGGFPAQRSALVVELRGGARFVRELSLNKPPMAFRYWIPSHPKNELARQASTTEFVAIASAAN